jgi:hypothetical protein
MIEKNILYRWRVPLMIDVTTNLDSEFIVHGEDGSVEVKLGAPQAFQLPTGHIIEPDGTLTDPDGTKRRVILKDGKYVGTQFFRADGSPAASGEIVILPDGQTVEQENLDL